MLAKSEIMAKYQRGSNDTGSPEVQVALLSSDIEQLNSHFQAHKKDNHSRQGLLKKVALRRKLLKYLKRVDLQRYLGLIKQLGLRG
jgi:small subunit ribosomal protein S15